MTRRDYKRFTVDTVFMSSNLIKIATPWKPAKKAFDEACEHFYQLEAQAGEDGKPEICLTNKSRATYLVNNKLLCKFDDGFGIPQGQSVNLNFYVVLLTDVPVTVNTTLEAMQLGLVARGTSVIVDSSEIMDGGWEWDVCLHLINIQVCAPFAKVLVPEKFPLVDLGLISWV